MSQNGDIGKRLWEALPTTDIPSLEEMRIDAEFRTAWEDSQSMFPASPESIGELFYRKGRMAGKDAASREILGKR